MEVLVTKRPIVAEIGASTATLTDILGRIESIKGRASEWGVTDPLRASLLAGNSIEADFTNSYYRSGFAEGGAPGILPGWTFSRTGSGYARTQAGRLTSFATGVPRITDRGLLMESSASNSLLRSQALATSPWTGGNVTVTNNDALAPDGTTTASKVAAGASGVDATAWFQSVAGSGYAPGNTYSVFVKKGSGATQANGFMVYNETALNFPIQINVNYDTGAITYEAGSTGARMTALADDWWLITMSFTGQANGDNLRCYVGFTGSPETPGEYCWAWGAQLSLGLIAPSYIPTTTATAVRGGDAAALTATAASSGAFVAEIVTPGNSSGSQSIVGAGSEAGLYLSAGVPYFFASGMNLALPGGALTQGNIVRLAASWEPGRRASTRDGLTPTTDTGAGPTGAIKIGADFEGYIRRFTVFGAPVTDAELQAMTA